MSYSPQGPNLYPPPPPQYPPPAYSEEYQTGYNPNYTEPSAPVYEPQASAPVREAEVARPAFNWRRAIFSGSIAYLVLRYSFRVVNPNAASISFVVGLFFGFLGDSRRKTFIFVERLNPFHYLSRTGSYQRSTPLYVPTPQRPVTVVTSYPAAPVIYPVVVPSYSAAPPRVVRVTTTSTNPIGFVSPVSYSNTSSTSFGGSSYTPPSGSSVSNVRSAPSPQQHTSARESSAPPLGGALRMHQPDVVPPSGRK